MTREAQAPAPVVFASSDDWASGLKTSKFHLARRLARSRRVLYMNSIGLRSARASAADAGRMWRKLREWLGGAQEVEPNLHVFTPLVVPWKRLPGVTALNRWLLRANVRWAMWRLAIRRPELWVFLPSHEALVGGLGEVRSIYYCVDEFALFAGVDTAVLRRQEQRLLQRVNVVFGTATELVNDRRALRPDIHYAPHGVDDEHFARALDAGEVPPPEVAALPSPRIGFVGLLEDWIDIDLIIGAAKARPHWQFVLIGKVAIDAARLRALPNVHLLGPRDYSVLPAMHSGLDCMMVPFRLTEMTRHVNPLKLREHLAAGRPVVATDLPEIRRYRHLVSIVHGLDEFVAAIDHELAADSPARRAERREAMRAESWDRRFEDVRRTIDQAPALAARVMPTVAGERA
jgi:glycosyltransferase involved in cell wall biosynthesis